MNNRRMSVIIPFFNAAATLSGCLDAFVQIADEHLEVLMVDNNSSDGSKEIAENMARQYPDRFVYLSEPGQGPAYARNTGASHANGELLAFIDADCIPSKDWAEKLFAAFTGPEIGAVAGRVVGFNKETVLDKFHYLFTLTGQRKSRTLRDFTIVDGGFPTANLAVKRDVFEQINGFDESMKIYSEDYDLCARIYRAGFSIRYTAEAIVFHKHRNSVKGTWKQSYGFGTGHAVLLKKYFKRLVIITLPRFQYVSRQWPLCMWIHLAGVDKKILGLAIISFFWWPFSFTIPAYLWFLYRDMRGRLNREGLTASTMERWQMVFIMFLKSAALTIGRLTGSIRNRVVCV